MDKTFWLLSLFNIALIVQAMENLNHIKTQTYWLHVLSSKRLVGVTGLLHEMLSTTAQLKFN